MIIRFEWDPDKAVKNFKKHKVSFEMAVRAFADPFALTEQDRIESGEQRWQTLGAVGDYCLLLVAHKILDEHEDEEPVEVIRIISARQADRKERRRYEETTR
jgi:uncharacterized DUF497 family protein